ncbi:MAG TPA: substrate-binding domain-containing protein [Planctomycetaceae bacterium]|nr:substrate-binding domain-containing protein [Planctomycetaceae bacterium]HQZ64684.1 substrate-binding domain-containing protein [Planctomycetaceae bacterium]HRA89640.1 substrate-binding domain-containing protein [Planctomycetaceae bacterium]
MFQRFTHLAWLLGVGFLLLPGCTESADSTGTASGTTAANSSTDAPGSKAMRRIILLNNTDSPFWDAARAGIEKAAADLKLSENGFTASMDTNQGAEEGQIEKLRQYGTQDDIAAVIISPTSATNPAIADELKKLKEKGLIIGCFDSDLDEKFRSIREFYVGTDNVKGGKVLGTAAKNLKPDGGEYVQFVGFDSQQNAYQRMDGFTSAVGDKFVQKDRRVDETDRSRARDNVRDSIDQNPKLNVLVGIWSYNAPAIVDIVKEKNVREKFAVVTFDAEQLAIEQMGNGMIDAMVVQNPFAMGYDSVKYAFAKLKGDDATVAELFPNMNEPGGNIRDTGLKVVVPDSGTPLTPEMFKEFGAGVQFLTLKEFRAWLAEYNLTSS